MSRKAYTNPVVQEFENQRPTGPTWLKATPAALAVVAYESGLYEGTVNKISLVSVALIAGACAVRSALSNSKIDGLIQGYSTRRHEEEIAVSANLVERHKDPTQ